MILKPKIPAYLIATKLWSSLPNPAYSPRLVTLNSSGYQRSWPTGSSGHFPLPNDLIVSEEYLPNSGLTILRNEELPSREELQSVFHMMPQAQEAFGVYIWGNFLINMIDQTEILKSYPDIWCFRDTKYDLLTPFIGVMIRYPTPGVKGVYVSVQTFNPYPYFTFDNNVVDQPSEQITAAKLNWQRFLSIMANLKGSIKEVSEQEYETDLTVEGGGIVKFANSLAAEAKEVLGKIVLDVI
jgi:hypothetical protein